MSDQNTSDQSMSDQSTSETTGERVRSEVRPEAVRFDDRGLVLAVVQQHDTGEVLMVAWMDAAALSRTLELGEAVFYSRSRQEQWHKGATSGNVQRVVDVRVDCDADALLVLVDQQGDGVACHTGERSCFHRRIGGSPAGAALAAPPLASDDPHDHPRARRPQAPEPRSTET